MIKKLIGSVLLSLGLVTGLKSGGLGSTSIYDYSYLKITGDKKISLSEYKGKKILIVNTASECGYTPQYEGLQKLYDTYKEKLVILGFPCNQFGGQEPGQEPEIRNFCKMNYGVTFPMSSKIDVKGTNQDPIYKWLTHKMLNGVMDSEVKWNFNKYLIDENGNLIGYFPSKITPLDTAITNKL